MFVKSDYPQQQSKKFDMTLVLHCYAVLPLYITRQNLLTGAKDKIFY